MEMQHPAARRVDPHIFSAGEYLKILKKCARSAAMVCTGVFPCNIAALYCIFIGIEENVIWVSFTGLALFLTGMGLLTAGIFSFKKWLADGLLSAPRTLLSRDEYWEIAEKQRDNRSIQIPIIFISLFLLVASAVMALAGQGKAWMICCLIAAAVFFIVLPSYAIRSRGFSLLLRTHENQTEEIRAQMAEEMPLQSLWQPNQQQKSQPAANHPKQKRALRQWLADNKGNMLEGILELLFELFDS